MPAPQPFDDADYVRFIVTHTTIPAPTAAATINAIRALAYTTLATGRRIALDNLYTITNTRRPARTVTLPNSNRRFAIPTYRTIIIHASPQLRAALNPPTPTPPPEILAQVPPADTYNSASDIPFARYHHTPRTNDPGTATAADFIDAIRRAAQTTEHTAHLALHAYYLATTYALTSNRKCMHPQLYTIAPRWRGPRREIQPGTRKVINTPGQNDLTITPAEKLLLAVNGPRVSVEIPWDHPILTTPNDSPPPTAEPPTPPANPPTPPSAPQPTPTQEQQPTPPEPTAAEPTAQPAPTLPETTPPPDASQTPTPTSTTTTPTNTTTEPPPPEPDPYFPLIPNADLATLHAMPDYPAAAERITNLHASNYWRAYELENKSTAARTPAEALIASPILSVTLPTSPNGQPPFYFTTEIWTWAHD